MSLAKKLVEALEEAEQSVEYWRDIAVTDFTRDLHARMAKLGVSQGELARRMGTSRPYITKLLDGGNFTLQTMVKLATALDAVVRIRMEGKEERAADREAARGAADSEDVLDLVIEAEDQSQRRVAARAPLKIRLQDGEDETVGKKPKRRKS